MSEVPPPRVHLPALLLGAALLLAMHLGLLWYYGPLQWPDSDGYTSYADQILAGSGWLTESKVGSVSYFRAPGYPLFLALVSLLSGGFSPLVVTLVQTAIGVVTYCMLARFGRACGLGPLGAVLAAWLFSVSLVVTYDLSILSDSLFTHLFLIGVCLLLVPLAEGRPATMGRAVAAGLLLAASTLVREATVYLLPVLAVAMLLLAGAGAVTTRRRLLLVAVFILPALLALVGFQQWNRLRAGEAFTTTVGQSVYLLHPLRAEQRGGHAFVEPRLREAYKAASGDYDYERVVSMNNYLATKYRLDALDQLRLSKAAYWQAWRADPKNMLREFVTDFRVAYAFHLVSVIKAVRDYPQWAGVGRRTGFREQTQEFRRNPTLEDGISIAVEAVSRFVSSVIFLGCVAGVPLLFLVPAWRRSVPDIRQRITLLFGWAVYVGMNGMYMMVHNTEARYTLPGQAFAIVTGLAVLGLLRPLRGLRRA